MDAQKVKLSKLKPDSVNARKHNDNNIQQIARALEEFGQHAPIVVQESTGRILVGNGRYEAMKLLGWEEADVLYVDDDNVTATRRALADNRTAELAEWDDDVLRQLLSEMDDAPPGWTDEELDALVSDIPEMMTDVDSVTTKDGQYDKTKMPVNVGSFLFFMSKDEQEEFSINFGVFYDKELKDSPVANEILKRKVAEAADEIRDTV